MHLFLHNMKRSLRRRRHEHRTDYKARCTLLSSGKPRIIVRKTNRYIIVQAVTTEGAQDRVLAGTTSKVLLDKGWPSMHAGSLKSLPAAYLVGVLLGKQLKGKVEEAVLDLGMHRNIHKSRVYAVLKGLIDSGIHVPHSDEVLPTESDFERATRVRDIFKKMKEKF